MEPCRLNHFFQLFAMLELEKFAIGSIVLPHAGQTAFRCFALRIQVRERSLETPKDYSGYPCGAPRCAVVPIEGSLIPLYKLEDIPLAGHVNEVMSVSLITLK